MSPEIWSILTTGIVILIAIATSNRSLRREMVERVNGVRQELSERLGGLSGRVDGLNGRVDGLSGGVDGLSGRVDGLSGRVDQLSGIVDGLGQQVDGLRREMHEDLGDVRERLGRVEGLLEGLGFARNRLHGKERTGKGPSASPAS